MGKSGDQAVVTGRVLRVYVLVFAAFVVLCAVGCQSIQRKVLFFPSHHDNDNGFVRWVHGGRVIGFAREVAAPDNVWLMLHGNGGQATDRTYALFAFDPADSVYILEYPGYGQRAGQPSRRAFDAAAREGYADLRARFPGKRVCVVGESLGSGPASMLSHERPAPDKIALVVPFDRIVDVAHDQVPWLPVSLILMGTWDNVEALRGYAGPIEIFGAEQRGDQRAARAGIGEVGAAGAVPPDRWRPRLGERPRRGVPLSLIARPSSRTRR